MDSYTFALALGGAGLVAMAATGLAHTGSHDGSGVHGVAGHAHAQHGDGPAHGIHPSEPHLTPHATAHHAGGFKSTMLALASPRTMFSLLVGFGLTGVVARPVLEGVVLLIAALAGAVVFELALVAPVWRLVFRFASNPATTLEGSLLSEARAASGFDGNGQGLVTVEVDGQLVQCLGTLRADDMALGVRVHAGDVLRVEDVDAVRSRCTVSYVRHGAK